MFIKLLNVAGALVRSNGMTLYSKWPWWVLNAVLYTSFSSILIWWYPEVHVSDNGGTTQLDGTKLAYPNLALAGGPIAGSLDR
jgi:hypothetical protein